MDSTKSTSDPAKAQPFKEQGHYTVLHDAIFDHVMPVCPPNAWKVLCLIIRKTRGWKKECDQISYGQLRKGTGIGSDATMSSALKWLRRNKLITVSAGKDAKGRQAITTYALNRDYEMWLPTSEIEERPTSEIEDNKNNTRQELNSVRESADAPPEHEQEKAEQKPVPTGAYIVRELYNRINAAKGRGVSILSPSGEEERSIGSMAKSAIERDDKPIDDCLMALDFMVAKASGQIEGEKVAWCSFRTALLKVEAGWRPPRHLRAVDEREQEKNRKMHELMARTVRGEDVTDEEWEEAMNG